MRNKVAIYHFTNGSQKRPLVYQKQLNKLIELSASLGFSDADIFCDKSILRCNHSEFERFMASTEEYSALITKDFYHISKNTMACMNIMHELQKKNIPIYTLENGCFCWTNAPFEKPISIATYCCRFGTADEMKEIIPVHNDILSMFARKKTKWLVVDQYYDESLMQKDDEQIQLKKLIANKHKYDLVLVHNLNDIHWRTANFCKIREQLQLDIYSLQEGYLQYRKGDMPYELC